MPAHSPAGRGFAPLRLSPARIRKGRFLLYPAQHSPVTIRTRLSPSMLRPFDPFRETMHDTTGLSPYIETDFRCGRKPVSISSEGICLPHPKFSLPSHSVANRRKNGLSMNTDSPNVQRGPVRSIDVEPHPASSATRIGKLFQHGRLSLAQISKRDRSPIGSRRERKPRDRSSGNYFEKKLLRYRLSRICIQKKDSFRPKRSPDSWPPYEYTDRRRPFQPATDRRTRFRN